MEGVPGDDGKPSENYQSWPLNILNASGQSVAIFKFNKYTDGQSRVILADVAYLDSGQDWTQLYIGHKADGSRFIEAEAPFTASDDATVKGAFTVEHAATFEAGISVTSGNVVASAGSFRTSGTMVAVIDDATADALVAPNSDLQRWPIAVYDKNGKAMAYCKLIRSASGLTRWQFLVVNHKSDGSMQMGGFETNITPEGNISTLAVTPASNSDSNAIATTEWVNDKGYAVDSTVVHKTGTETIDGSKTFQDSIFVSANPLIQSTNWSGIGIADTTRSETSSKLLCQLLDKDGKRFAGLEATAINDGRRSFQLIGRNRADTGWVNFIKFFENTDGYVYATLQNSPDSTASNNTVATVGYVKGLGYATESWVLSQLSTSIPAGAIMYFAQSDVPDGWLFCNGSNVSRTTYANLFAAIGTKYGSGNGSSTFTLPNLRDIFIQGASSTSNVGQSVAAGLPNITGYGPLAANGAGDSDFSGVFYRDGSMTGAIAEGGSTDAKVSFSASRSSGLYGASTTVQPPAIRLLPCIKS